VQGGAIRNELYGFLQVGFQFALSILSIFQELYIETSQSKAASSLTDGTYNGGIAYLSEDRDFGCRNVGQLSSSCDIRRRLTQGQTLRCRATCEGLQELRREDFVQDLEL